MLVQFLVQDEADLGRWQSGVLTVGGTPEAVVRGARAPARGRVAARPWRRRSGARSARAAAPQRYRVQQFRDGSWRTVGGTRTTGVKGFFTRTRPGRDRRAVPARRRRDGRREPGADRQRHRRLEERLDRRPAGRPRRAQLAPGAVARVLVVAPAQAASCRGGSGCPAPCRSAPRRRARAGRGASSSSPVPQRFGSENCHLAALVDERHAPSPPPRPASSPRPRTSRRSRARRRRGRGRAAASRSPPASPFQRTPTTTQSAVLCSFTLTTPSREPGRYGDAETLRDDAVEAERLEAVEPAARLVELARARREPEALDRVLELRAGAPRAAASTPARRPRAAGRRRRTRPGSPPTAAGSATRPGGGASASRRSRARRPRTITISPSSAERGGSSSPSGRSSGK